MTYAEWKTYRWEVLHLPGPVDRWLVANIRSPRINFLQHYLMSKGGYGYVTCFIEIKSEEVCFFVIQIYQCVGLIYYLAPKHESPCTKVDYVYTYINAVASPQSKTNLFLRTSPRAILEWFTGSNTAIDAPDWPSWDRKTWEFQQPELNFASLFMQMASWEANQNQVSFAQLRHRPMLTYFYSQAFRIRWPNGHNR